MNIYQQLLSLLETTFNLEGDLHILAVSAKVHTVDENERPVHKVRVALTYKEGDLICPYYDGTELFVLFNETGIEFTNEGQESVNGDSWEFVYEEKWADGPPIIEGSPKHIALNWVAQLAPPFYVSSVALNADNQ